ncbi:protein of unknown function [Taphrina deformans PYCC 5710]|uniref:Oligopeptide transporter n=1 Tax=Taphrina deformans (strain PYCC 5710 / ATCC 11124 / CBS 356.35 / IMI 108563 / JCM 9778 / NBRC 8474) TaxID=1097556 RepID=R4XF43_TAPDE|nr:protein of unknown function [Taphrina deformans PYCC 5710]|eukprot:CCG84487.1 protein of unknown function [Taphrina deformans PYCC 5710]
MDRSDSLDDLEDHEYGQDSDPLLHNQPIDSVEHIRAAEEAEFTVRAVVVGLAIGTLVCVSNCYFGLQTGWISMMSLPASLLGFGVFKLFQGHLNPEFSRVENVLVQTIAVASGTMPLGAGLVGVIPALEKLLTKEEGGPLHISLAKLIFWSAGVAFFGVFFAVPLRKQVIIKEKLKFPSGTATAEMITILHKKASTATDGQPVAKNIKDELPYSTKIKYLAWSFIASSITTVLTFFIPAFRRLAIFDWVTLYHFSLKSEWLIAFQPSLAYMGQGIIMGVNTTLSMLLGAVIGWAVLSPIAKNNGWAPGPVGAYNDGVRGWLIWVSLAIMLSDSIVSLLVVTVRWIIERSSILSREVQDSEDGAYEAPPSALVPIKWTLLGLAASTVLCVVAIAVVFPEVPVYLSLTSICLALFLSVLGVRALGETDLNPVSGIGKISQLLFAFLIKRGSPNAILINLVAGGVAEAGAQQAGDLMQDLKTGHLLGASPRVQTYGQLIGSVYSVVLSVLVYRLYTTLYEIPGDLFAIPTAYQWIDCSRLVNGDGLPPHVRDPALCLAILFGCVSLVRSSVPQHVWWRAYLPSGLAVAVGMYNTVDFTLARVVGGVAGAWWVRECERRNRKEYKILAVIVASGFILGEGVFGSTFMLLFSLLRR